MSTNALISLIYKKSLKVSNATNKKFQLGEIINFVQVDAGKLMMISENIASVLKLPVLIGVCVITLFYFLGVSFLAGIVVILLAMGSNFCIGKFSA